MTQTLNLELVTPEKLEFSGTVQMVEVPGDMGDFGVLAGHSPFVSLIRPGAVTLHKEDGETTRLFVSGGLAEVNPEGCTILAETVEDLSQVTAESARERLSEAINALELAATDDQRQAAERIKRTAEAILMEITGH